MGRSAKYRDAPGRQISSFGPDLSRSSFMEFVMAHVLDVLEYARDQLEPWAVFLPPLVPATIRPAGCSRFEALASLASNSLPGLGHVVNVLLAASSLTESADPAVLQPLWAEEAMHRSYTMLRLLDARGNQCNDLAGIQIDEGLACHLAVLFRSLDIDSANQDLPCATLMRDMVTDLVALFGPRPGLGAITINTTIERLRLPAYKRRALVLAAAELVMNALLHAFPGRARGRIEVSLTMPSPLLARLQVNDDGIGLCGGQPDSRCGVAGGLADLLEADLVYLRTSTLTIAEILFPVGRA
jgi:hypothetical protein